MFYIYYFQVSADTHTSITSRIDQPTVKISPHVLPLGGGHEYSMSALAMPFIDNDLLWSSDHDGKMVDLSSCLQVKNICFLKNR